MLTIYCFRETAKFHTITSISGCSTSSGTHLLSGIADSCSSCSPAPPCPPRRLLVVPGSSSLSPAPPRRPRRPLVVHGGSSSSTAPQSRPRRPVVVHNASSSSPASLAPPQRHRHPPLCRLAQFSLVLRDVPAVLTSLANPRPQEPSGHPRHQQGPPC
jgi:hypothetical protein